MPALPYAALAMMPAGEHAEVLVRDTASIADLLACPVCRGGLRAAPDGRLACATPGCRQFDQGFDRVGGTDVLLDYATSIIDRDAMRASKGASVVRRGRWRERLSRIVDGQNRFTPHFARAMVRELAGAAHARRPVILVIGGGGVGSGSDDLYTSPAVDVVAFDIYLSPHVSFVADGHAIPIKDASVDAVWIQSVLEHVADPQGVVVEILRVLRPGGLVFVDTSFMWPVNEGAYDYNRWTPSGLRWLLRDLEVIAAGSSSGPGTMAVLAIRYLLQSLLRSTKLGQIAAFPFFWLRFLDRLCDARRGLDAAAGLFLYGRRADAPLDLTGLIGFYDDQPALQRASRHLGR